MNENDLSQAFELMDLSGINTDELFSAAKDMMETMVEYKELRMRYSCAIKEISTKFEVLDTEFRARYQRNPIKSITSRLKSNKSIIGKCARKGIDFDLDEIEEHLNDIAGVRVVCSYIDDIYMLADALISQDDIRLIARKDYIKNPKPNGYRSLHLIVEVPVFFAQAKRAMKVEVQIRTIAMDYWASLEHQLKYKKDVPEEAMVIDRLKNCAQTMASLDNEMQLIRDQLDLGQGEMTEDDILFEKIKRLDFDLE